MVAFKIITGKAKETLTASTHTEFPSQNNKLSLNLMPFVLNLLSTEAATNPACASAVGCAVECPSCFEKRIFLVLVIFA